MRDFPWDQAVMGWIHITSAALIVGGLGFWLIARPAMREAGAEASILARYRPWFWGAAALLAATGAFTWTVRLAQGYPGFYFHVLYTKILLYVTLFGLAGTLTRQRDSGTRVQRNSAVLLTCVGLCVVILFLSAFMRRVKPAPAKAMGTLQEFPIVSRIGEPSTCRPS
ncbi:MAG TPA: hypothetical protein VGM37_11655 [Armatimonadota bacterium]|jgi:putative copper export protein